MLTKTTAISFAILLGAHGGATAGPLDPPPGPIAPTMKTLTEIRPSTAISAENTPGDATSKYVITSPGSYYLTKNEAVLFLQGQQVGIRVEANNVSIDLNGFRLVGTAGTSAGIEVITGVHAVRVHNGTITSFEKGIQTTTSTEGLVVRRVRVRDCTSHAITAGLRATVDRCLITDNGGDGIRILSGEVSGSRIISNGGVGIEGAAFIAENNIVYQNGENGIESTSGSLISRNLVVQNGSLGSHAGILLTSERNRVEENHCALNTVGIGTDFSDNLVVRNSSGTNTVNYEVPPCPGCLSGFGSVVSLLRIDIENACLNYEHD